MPNSFTDLNDYGDEPISFEDARAYSITFSANATSNQSVSVTEDASFYTPAGINILSSQSLPANIVYTINAASISSNAIVSWNSLPGDVTQTNPSPGVYVVTGPIGNSGWELIKQASFVAKDVANAFSYTSNIQYPNTANTALTNTWSWTTNVSVTSSHAELSNPTNFTWDEDTTYTITGYPQITDAYSGSLPYTMAITPNTTAAVLTMTTTGGTANSSFDSTNRILTLTGNKTAVNASLANVQVVPIPDYDQNFSFNYSLTNPVSNLNTQVTQLANIGNTNQEWSNSNVARAYYTNVENYLFANTVPQILETVSGATYTVGLTLNSNIGIITTNTYASPTGWSTGNLTFTTTGNKATVNSDMGNIKFFPTGNITSNTTVGLSSARAGGPAFTDTFALNNVPIGNVFNFSATNTYDENTFKTILGNTITDANGLNQTYTVNVQQLSGNTGQWYVNGNLVGYANSVYTLSNSQANINSANLVYLPSINNRGNVTILYNQERTNYLGNVTQANVSAVYSLGNASSYVSNMINRSYTSNTVNNIFSTSTPSVTDGSDIGQTYTISLNSSLGQFGNSNSTLANTYSYTGNLTQVNSNFSNVVFAPFGGQSGNGTFTYTQSRNGVSQVNVSKTLTGTAVALPNATVTITSSGSYTPDFWPSNYLTVNILAVGGGGGASGTASDDSLRSEYGGSGGGGGNVKVSANITLSNSVSYTTTIGAAGTKGVSSSSPGPFTISLDGSDGGITRFVGGAIDIIAPGGYGGGGGGGYGRYTNFQGGASGSNSGGTDTVTTYGSQYGANGNYGGGGAGSAGNGSNAIQGGNAATAMGGPGGPGTNTSAGTFGAGGNGRKYTPVTSSNYGSGGGHSGTSLNSAQDGQPGIMIITWNT